MSKLHFTLPLPLFLCSKSPRRAQLLKNLGISFEIVPIDTSESFPKDLTPEEIPIFISHKKWETAQSQVTVSPCFILTADTMVFLDQKPLGKPKDREEALHFLKLLSGQTHFVITGFSLGLSTERFPRVQKAVTSTVQFKILEEQAILDYVDSGSPFDKAGGYGYQEDQGFNFVRSVTGSESNIVGLPIEEVLSELHKLTQDYLKSSPSLKEESLDHSQRKLLEVKSHLPTSCQIITVSKKQPLEAIESLYKQGHLDFGENYSQELIEKQFHLKHLKDLRWHFIGALQKNKIKHLIGHVQLIHSVGSLETCLLIDDLAQKKNLIQDILLQVNLAHEPTKNGWMDSFLLESLDLLSKLTHIRIRGLMTLPPLHDNPEVMRPFFQQLLQLQKEIALKIPTCQELSMGTSHDYLIAVEEGATMIRLGTILFGNRV
jgi:PLP dependent protein